MNASTSLDSRELIPLHPTQIAKVNIEPLQIRGPILPMQILPPMVSAGMETTENAPIVSIRIIAFMPTTFLGKEPIQLYQQTSEPETELKLVVQYSSAETNPISFNTWYIGYDRVLEEGEVIETIVTSVENIDIIDANPKTSRGTVTHVLQS